MKRAKIIYWATTGFVSVMMLFSAYSYLTNEEIKGAFVHLGFPGYFRVELALAKIVGAVLLLLPIKNGLLKDAAYVGFTITFISAFVAHVSSGDPVPVATAPLVFLGILIVSYIYKNKTLHTQAI